jgi:hypothetical protein
MDFVSNRIYQLLKLGGHPSSPIADMTHSNFPILGTVKALDLGCSVICQNPEVRSNFPYTFGDILHRLFVEMAVIVLGSKILHPSKTSILLAN